MAKGYANRDNAKVQELWAYIYDRLGYGSLVSDGYQMIPLDFTDFEVKQSIDGKLVRFVKKGYKLQPPIGLHSFRLRNALILASLFCLYQW